MEVDSGALLRKAMTAMLMMVLYGSKPNLMYETKVQWKLMLTRTTCHGTPSPSSLVHMTWKTTLHRRIIKTSSYSLAVVSITQLAFLLILLCSIGVVIRQRSHCVP